MPLHPSSWHANLRQRWAHRARVIEAMVLLTAAGVAQRAIPMPRWSRALGRHGAVPTEWHGRRIEGLPKRTGSLVELRAAVAVAAGSRHLPWEPTCLAEATAGQILLRQMGASGVVVIGLRPTDGPPGSKWDAHAWLLGSRGALTGGPAARGFTATTVYEVPGGLAANGIDLASAK